MKPPNGPGHLLFNNAGSAMLGTFEHETIEEMEWLIDLFAGSPTEEVTDD